jgi:hypothetical protein
MRKVSVETLHLFGPTVPHILDQAGKLRADYIGHRGAWAQCV